VNGTTACYQANNLRHVEWPRRLLSWRWNSRCMTARQQRHMQDSYVSQLGPIAATGVFSMIISKLQWPVRLFKTRAQVPRSSTISFLTKRSTLIEAGAVAYGQFMEGRVSKSRKQERRSLLQSSRRFEWRGKRR